MKLSAIALITICGFLGCTKANPDLCCTDEANCESLGIPTSDMCSDGLVCRGNQCIAETCSANTDCDASLPFCSSDMLCAATCDDNSQCPGFGEDATDLICSNGACVECVMSSDCSGATPACSNNVCVQCLMNSDCSGATPICDGDACRGCQADSECPSTVCGTDGACVDPADIVFLDAGGTDGGSCTMATPCRTMGYAATQTSQTRNAISIAMGTYNEKSYTITTTTTAATTLDIHGHGAAFVSNADGPAYLFEIGATIRDLVIDGGGAGTALGLDSTNDTYDLENVEIEHGARALNASGTVTAHQLLLHDTGQFITISGGSFIADRVVAHDGSLGIEVDAGASIQITNMMMYTVTEAPGVDIEDGVGTIASSTIVNTGDPGNPTALGVNCKSSITVRSSIVWSSAVAGRPVVSGCNMATSIVGPLALTGSLNVDPMFLSAGSDDFHLSSTSPAIDMVDTGPADDFEGDARPQGARFDIGADEYKP